MLYFERPLKKLRIIMVSQNTLRTLGPMPALCTSSFEESVNLCCLVGVARGPIRRNRSNRLKTILLLSSCRMLLDTEPKYGSCNEIYLGEGEGSTGASRC